jgi:N-acetylmuramoyl-L-alanine amidase
MSVAARACLAGALAWMSALGPSWANPPPAPPPPLAGEELVLSSDLRIRVRQGRIIELFVLPASGEGYAEIAARVTGDAQLGPVLSDWNGSRSPSPERYVRVPLSLLSDDYRALILVNLFPEDRRDGADWIHVARSGALPTYDEGLWQVAEWFVGAGARFEELQALNGLEGPELRAGQEVRIPASMLHPAIRSTTGTADGSLSYGEDQLGAYAGYRLRPGEALYSAVVVRFTGRTASEDVMALSRELAVRSGIRDLTDIPVGHLVKIPYDVLEPEYLPPNHPRRVRAEQAKRALADALAQEPVAGARGGLEGVVVLLDPGHGGRDLGTMNNGIWEHDYVYDVTCRLRRLLRSRSQARVFMTLLDTETGCEPASTDKLLANRQGTVQTHPPFTAREEGEAAIAVNLRWYLANSVYRRETKTGVKPDRVVFLSLHADARHPSLRGVMVYVSGARFPADSRSHNSATYRRYQEVRETPKAKLSQKARVRSEAVSRKLADEIVDSFGDHGLPVQTHKPVRDRVIRGKREWIPAVLRNNEIPAKVLVEMVNLTNGKDAALLASATQRERLAEALFVALYGHFGQKAPPPPGPPAAVAGR